MRQQDLTETLQALVRRHGISSVLHSLADIQSSSEASISPSSPRRTGKATKTSSAIDYVNKMVLPADKAEVIARAAERFEDRGFLPSIADIREFCRIHGIELARTASRTSSVSRVFRILATMDTDRVVRILDDGAFSGPTRLAPIADAIRSYPAKRRHTHYADVTQPVIDTTTGDHTENP